MFLYSLYLRWTGKYKSNYKKFSRSFLLKLLSGSDDLMYSGKYLESQVKQGNLLVVMALNPTELPHKIGKSWNAFYKRVKLIEFNNIKDFNKEFSF